MNSMNWFKPYPKLDPSQRDFIDSKFNVNSNYWIQGHAGSGKSLILVHSLIKAFETNPNIKVCFVVYTHALIDMMLTGIPTELKFKVKVMTYVNFKETSENYDLILVDEVQDLPADILKNIENRAKKVICAGDINQSIYDNTVSPNEIENLIKPQLFALKIIHRLTKTIIKIASFFKKDILEAKENWNNINVGVIIGKAKPYSSDEIEFVWRKAKIQAANIKSPTVVLLPNHEQIINFMKFVLEYEKKPPFNDSIPSTREGNGKRNDHLEKHNVKLEYIGNSFGSLENAVSKNKVMIMTYHSSKGLDFKNVFIPELFDGKDIWRGNEERSKTLFYVALTRSRENLYMTYASNNPHRYVNLIQGECKVKDISELLVELEKQENLMNGSFSVDGDDDIAF
jgi:superfamily I DNA/RNA helicase